MAKLRRLEADAELTDVQRKQLEALAALEAVAAAEAAKSRRGRRGIGRNLDRRPRSKEILH